MQKIIAIGSKARNGKDTFANAFKKLNPDSTIIHWADSLYEEASNNINETPLIVKSGNLYFFKQLNGSYELISNFITNNSYYKQLFESHDTTIKPMTDKNPLLLQLYGTDYRRAMNENYWVNRLMDKLTNIKTEYILIPDTRFMNEFDFIKRIGGYYIKVVRVMPDGSQYIDPSRDANHKSEIDLDDVTPDYVVNCPDGKTEEMDRFVLSFLGTIK